MKKFGVFFKEFNTLLIYEIRKEKIDENYIKIYSTNLELT